MLKSRKKILLSSIAMLLVALVALGTATFAWYANVTSVTAEYTKFSATAADGIVIRHWSDQGEFAHQSSETGFAAQTAWKNALNAANNNKLDEKTSLSPRAITVKNGDNLIAFADVQGAAATADGRESYKATNIDDVKTHAQVLSDDQYLIDHMYVAGESGPINVNMSIKMNKAATDTSYLNLAVYIDGALQKVFTTDSSATTRDLVITSGVASEGANYNPTVLTTTAQAVNATAFQASSKASGGTRVDIIAYVDGMNDNCKTSTVDITDFSVDYTFSIAA